MLKKGKARARGAAVAEINVVPYIDVMLVLLVIFMITAPMLTQGVSVDLPKAQSETLKSTDRDPVILSVDEQGHFFLNIHTNPDEPMDPQALAVRVAAELEVAKQANQNVNVLVKGDQGVSYGKVVEAMALLKQAGAEKVGLLTDSSGLNAEQKA
jgi:biopolymer transport protein TolR